MESWEDVHPIKTSFIRSESNPLVVNIVPPEEYLLSTKFDVELNKPMGSITISIPYSSFQPIRHKLAGTYQQEEETQVDQLWQNTLQERLKETKLEMCVNLGRTKLSIRDLLNLKTGDIMILDKHFTDPLVAKVEGIPKYEGYVGRLKDRKVFRVEQNL
jgi:flagellar motor switch protein FliM